MSKQYDSPFGELVSNSSVGIVIPTYYDGPDGKWKGLVNKLIPSIHNLLPLRNVTFLVNFQGYPDYDVQEVLGEFKSKIDTLSDQVRWDLKCISRGYYDAPISMVMIRNDTMMINPDLKYYMFMDDDTKFNPGAGKHYNDILCFMDEDNNLGSVMSAGFLGGYNYVGKLKDNIAKWWMTNRGLILRNIILENNTRESVVYGKEALRNAVGGMEEIVACCEMLSRGYITATYFNNPTTAKASNLTDGNNRYEKDTIHDLEIFSEGFKKYLLDKYPDENIELFIEDLSDTSTFRKGLYAIQHFIYDKSKEVPND